MNTTRFLGGVAAATVVLAALAGCSDPAPPASAPPPADNAPSASTPGPGTAHNDADATFVQGMVPHHRQAITMSDLAASRAASPEVKDLAARISAAQGPEIDQMNRMLPAWGMPPGGQGMPGMGSMPGMEPNSMGGMTGMTNPDQMRRLESSSGAAFDRAFLDMMIQHHTGAIQMARTELTQGQNTEAKQLAQATIDAQQAEIQQMQILLGRV